MIGRAQYHTNHNVYILGAGFSAERGLPLVSNFLTKMRESLPWLSINKRQGDIDAITRILDFRKAASAAGYRIKINLDNIEELFSLAAILPNHELTESLRRSIAATLDFASSDEQASAYSRSSLNFKLTANPTSGLGNWIFPIPNSTSKEPHLKADRYLYYLGLMAGRLDEDPSDQRNSFITFNYDLVADKALNALGYWIDYGLEDQKEPTDEPILLAKLHGSINWYEEKRDQFALYIDRSFARPHSTQLSPYLIPPTWQKSVNPQIARVWERAIDCLKTATQVIVIGYSMPETDNHFRYLLAKGLEENISLQKIHFVNPDADALKGRVMRVFREKTEEEGLLKMHPFNTWTLLEQRNHLIDRGDLIIH